MWRMKSSTAQRQFIVQFLLAYLQLASQYVPVPLLSEPVWWCDRWLYFWVLIDKASLIIGWKSETLWGNWFLFTWAKDLGLFWCLYCLPVSLSCSLSLFQSPSLWSHSVSLWKNLVCSRTRLICPRICRCFWSTILKLARKERERESQAEREGDIKREEKKKRERQPALIGGLRRLRSGSAQIWFARHVFDSFFASCLTTSRPSAVVPAATVTDL